jgi:hypothetical protein
MKKDIIKLNVIIIIVWIFQINDITAQVLNPLLGGVWEIQNRHYLYYKTENSNEYSVKEMTVYNGNQITFKIDSIIAYSTGILNFFNVEKYTVLKYNNILENQDEALNLKLILNSYGNIQDVIFFQDKNGIKNYLYLLDNDLLIWPMDMNLFVLKRSKTLKKASWLLDSKGYFTIKGYDNSSFEINLPNKFKEIKIECSNLDINGKLTLLSINKSNLKTKLFAFNSLNIEPLILTNEIVNYKLKFVLMINSSQKDWIIKYKIIR